MSTACLAPPGLPPGRVDQHVVTGIATERSATTRLKDPPGAGLSGGAARLLEDRSLLDMLATPSTSLRSKLDFVPAPEPGESACYYCNGYGSSVTTRLKDAPTCCTALVAGHSSPFACRKSSRSTAPRWCGQNKLLLEQTERA